MNLRARRSSLLSASDKWMRRGIVVAVMLFGAQGYSNYESHQASSSQTASLKQIKQEAHDIHSLLTNGKTSSAQLSKKIKAEENQIQTVDEQIKAQNVQIKSLLVTDHAQTVAQDKRSNALSSVRTKELQEVTTLVANQAASSAYLKTGVDSLRTILVYIGGSLTAICQATPNCTLPKA